MNNATEQVELNLAAYLENGFLDEEIINATLNPLNYCLGDILVFTRAGHPLPTSAYNALCCLIVEEYLYFPVDIIKDSILNHSVQETVADAITLDIAIFLAEQIVNCKLEPMVMFSKSNGWIPLNGGANG